MDEPWALEWIQADNTTFAHKQAFNRKTGKMRNKYASKYH
jgi:hypothetical protein